MVKLQQLAMETDVVDCLLKSNKYIYDDEKRRLVVVQPKPKVTCPHTKFSDLFVVTYIEKDLHN